MPGFVKRGGIWYARIWYQGRETLRSLRTANREEAEKAARKFEESLKGATSTRFQLQAVLDRSIREVRNGEAELLADDLTRALGTILLTMPENRRDELRVRLTRDVLSNQVRKISIAEGWNSWLAHPNRRTQPKERTLVGYEAIWRRFALWCETKQLTWFHQIQESDCEAYGTDLWNSHVSPSTFNAHLKLLRSIFGTLELGAGLTCNPWRHLQTKALLRTEGRRNLTDDELSTVLHKAEGSMRLLMVVGIFTALRLGDAVGLRWKDIDFNRGVVSVVPMKTSRTGKRIEVPLLPPLRRLLESARLKGSGDLVFPVEAELHDRGELTKRIQRLFEGCGLQTTETPGHKHRRRAVVRVGFHSLRHSFVTMCAKAGTPQPIVQNLVGHSSPAMTAHYTHLDADDTRRAIAGVGTTIQLPEEEKMEESINEILNSALARIQPAVESDQGIPDSPADQDGT